MDLNETFTRAKQAEDEKEEKWFTEMHELVRRKPPEIKIEDGRMVFDQPWDCRADGK